MNYVYLQYPAFVAGQTNLQNKTKANQVFEVGLIPGIKLFHFQEYRPLRWDFHSCFLSWSESQNQLRANEVRKYDIVYDYWNETVGGRMSSMR